MSEGKYQKYTCPQKRSIHGSFLMLFFNMSTGVPYSTFDQEDFIVIFKNMTTIDMCPVLRPTEEEFSNFYEYAEKVD